MSKFFYKLGHQPKLSNSEWMSLTGQFNASVRSDWMLSEHWIEPFQTGGIVLGGEILQKLDPDKIEEKLKALLVKLHEETGSKKLGLAIPLKIQPQKLLRIAKSAGFAKINVLKPNQLPNYGHWKQSKIWLLGFFLENNFYLGKIKAFADQQFWGVMDTGLPQTDMKRGIINLKLARSLLNLSSKNLIWDPFAGLGRVAVAGMDIKSEFFLTDIDPVCLPQAQENIDWALNMWSKKIPSENLAKIHPIEALDAAKLDQFSQKVDFHNLAVVTEGFLGTNYFHTPSDEQIQKEFADQKQLWAKVLKAAAGLKIPELVFCVPSYRTSKGWVFANFMEQLIQEAGYIFQDGRSGVPINYARPDSFVGHAIYQIKLSKLK